MKPGAKSRKSSSYRYAVKYLVTLTRLNRKDRVRQQEIVQQVRRILKAEKRPGQVDLILAGDDLLKKLNRKFTGKHKATDVLSFPLQDSLPTDESMNYLGEIYISLDQAKRQAREFRFSLQEEVQRLVTHGTLHLLGYGHKKKTAARIMRRKEEEYLHART